MDFLHDADEEELEEEEEEDEEEEEPEADAAVDPAPPGPHSAAGAHTGLTDEELAALEATSVELLPDEERNTNNENYKQRLNLKYVHIGSMIAEACFSKPSLFQGNMLSFSKPSLFQGNMLSAHSCNVSQNPKS